MSNWVGFNKKEQHNNKRQAIIREAAIAFNESGYEGTSLDTIATRLGVTKKALYYYVKNKQEILYEIFCQWLDAQKTSIERANTDAQNGLQRLALYSEYYVVCVFEKLTSMDRITGELASLDSKYVKTIRKRRRDNDQKLIELVQQAIDAGEAADTDPHMVINTLNGALDWIFKWYKPGAMSPAQAARMTVDIIIKGVEKR